MRSLSRTTRRLVHTGFIVTLFAILGSLYWVNAILYKLPREQIKTETTNLLTDPFSTNPHSQRALSLWQAGLSADAKKEMRIASEFPSRVGAGVLGAASTPLSLIQEWESVPAQYQQQFEYWHSVIEAHPDWRDAYIQAARLAFQLGRTQEATALLETAHSLDPNSKTVQQLLEDIRR